MKSSERSFSHAGAFAAVAGVLIHGVSAFLHPGTAPHHTEAAFAHYATEGNWGLIHLGELLGILLMAAAALALAWRLRRGAIAWTILAGAAMVVFSGVYAVFIAVDGVALGIMVDRWASATTERRELLYETAFAVRQIEAGLFGIQWLMFGVAAALYSGAFFTSRGLPATSPWRRGMGWLSAAASAGALAFGVVQAQTGFTEQSMAFQTGLMVGVVWTLAVAAFLYRHPEDESRVADDGGGRMAELHR